MNDRAAPERGDDRARNKRGPEGSQRTESPPRREGAVSHAKPQNEGPKKSEGRHRSKAKLDADAQGAALAFGGDEAQGPQRPDTSESARVPDREDDDDTFALGGQSEGGRRASAQFKAALPRAMDTGDDARPGAAVAAASFVAHSAQAPAAPPPPTMTLVAAAGGGAMAARALAPAQNLEAIVAAFLASRTEEAAAALGSTSSSVSMAPGSADPNSADVRRPSTDWPPSAKVPSSSSSGPGTSAVLEVSGRP